MKITAFLILLTGEVDRSTLLITHYSIDFDVNFIDCQHSWNNVVVLWLVSESDEED